MSAEALNVHSPVGPSSGERWIFCPGSVPVTENLPDISSEYAREGNFAHYISECVRNDGCTTLSYKDQTSEGTPWLRDDGTPFVVDNEMVVALDDFHEYCEQFGGDENFVEIRVYYDEWVDNGFGTADHISINIAAKHLVVGDLKYGKGIQVNAKGNTQAKLYALGFYHDYGHLYDIEKITLFIGQPRLNHRDQWDISVEKLLKWAKEVVRPAGERVYEAKAVYDKTDEIPAEFFRAGAWCQWCKIKTTCNYRAKMIRQSLVAEIDELDDDELGEIEDLKPTPLYEMSDEDLGAFAGKLDMIRAWCTDIEKAVTSAVVKGKKILSGYDEDDEEEFYKMVEGRSNRKWRSEEAAEAELKRRKVRAGDMYKKTLLSPTQMEGVLGKKHKFFTEQNDDDEYMVVKPKGKPVLVAGSDTREPYRVGIDELEDVDDEQDDNINGDDSWLY